MQHSLIPPGAQRSRYEYSIQPTEDHEEFHEDVEGGKKPAVIRRPGKAPNYKPKPLTWPFIVGLVVLLCLAIGLVAFAKRALPDSDSDAVIVDEMPKFRFLARADLTNTSLVASPSPSKVVIASVTGTLSSQIVQSITGAKESASSAAVGSADRVSILDVSSTGSSTGSGTVQGPTSSSVSETVSDPVQRKQRPTSTVSVTISQTTVPSVSGSVDNSASSPERTLVNTSGRGDRRPNTTGESGSGINQQNAPIPTSSSSTSITYPNGVTAIRTSVIKTTLGSTTISKSTMTIVTTKTTVNTVTTFSESTSFRTYSTDMTTVITSSTPVTISLPPGPTFTRNGTFSGSEPPPVGSPQPLSTSFEQFTLTVTHPTEETSPVTITVPVTSKETGVVTLTSESTVMATIAPVVGEITVTIFSTAPILLPTGPNNQKQPPQTELKTQGNVVVTGVTVIGGETITRVDKGTPVVVVVPTNQVETVTNGPSIKVFTTQVGGSEFTSILVLTPTPATPVITANVATIVGGTPVTVVTQPPPRTFETTINGVVQTVVETPPPQTVISQAGGTLSTVGVAITAAAPGQPITFTVVNDIAGTPVTQVVVSTPAGGVSFLPITFSVTSNVGGTPTVVTITPRLTSFVTTIDGTPVTIVTTPLVTSFTTTAGGTLTTETSVITPTGTGLITLTFTTSSSGTLTTLTSTISPGTIFTTTHSGTLTTITSTPSLSTHISTRSKSTSTFTTTSPFTSTLPSPTSFSTPPTPPPVISSTRVYKWTESDIFLGTFLPPLLGVALVIPLRIIDLNAKLYQPFQSLAASTPTPGSQTLLMQYTGFMTFLTPIVTLLQGHPVPFLTTLMVLTGSLIVPLATEAIGLKLHGRCIRNTATPGCGPSLGVSPAPAHALIALMAAVILLLLIILLLISRWATGVNSNPWNLAGIASLAGNSQVRIRQHSSAAMRRAISEKHYGLGYFTNPNTGAEEYGIVLTDESAAALQPNESHDVTDDGLVNSGVTAERANSANRLPLMPLRYPWRGAVIAGQLGLLVFIIYYHVYYHVTINDRGRVFDNGRLWEFMNSNSFGVRFVAAIVGVIIAFCWQSFFLSVSIMAPYQLMAQRTQPAERSILFSSCTNPFSGIYAAVKQRHLFLFATSLAAILSELLPVFLANVFFSLAQTIRTATACAALSSIILGLLIAVLVASFFVKWPPMPVDPRSIAGTLYYVSQSHMLDNGDLDGVSGLDGSERERRVREKVRRYFYGVLVGGSWRRLGVDCDSLGPGEGVDTAYHGVGGGVMSGGLAEGHDGRVDERGGEYFADVSRDSRSAGTDEAPVLHEPDEGLLASGRNGYGSFLGPGPDTGHGTLHDTMPPSMMYGRDN